MERKVGRGIGLGNTCKPMAVSFQCMTKFTTIKKKKSKKAKKEIVLAIWDPFCFHTNIITFSSYSLKHTIDILIAAAQNLELA